MKPSSPLIERSHRFLGGALAGLLLAVMAASSAQAGVESVVGHYEGAWTNLTFNSTGKAVIDIGVNGATASILFDMDGFVFGAFDPPVISMPGTVEGDVIKIDSKGVGLFGNILGSIDSNAGTFDAVLTQIPGGFITKVTAQGTIGNGRMDLNYVVDFPGAASPTNPAHGVFSASVPTPLIVELPVRQGAQLALHWTGGKPMYQVQVRSSLTTGDWTNQGAPTSQTSATIPAPATGSVFIRVVGQ